MCEDRLRTEEAARSSNYDNNMGKFVNEVLSYAVRTKERHSSHQ